MDNYRQQPPEAGTYAEIYLPKRAEYQGALYDALTKGFEPSLVIEYLHAHRSNIENFMKPANEFYEVDFVNELPEYFADVYGGYSMYEVDGVFRPTQVGSAPIHERTQIIRMMFPLNLKRVTNGEIAKNKLEYAELVARAFLRSPHWKKESFARDYLALGSRDLSPEELQVVLQGVEKRARLVALFVFGYVVKRISEIANEQEIWVAFFWNLVITRVVSDPENG